jgi:DNA mismatch endonuclease (patch repair protein)
LIAFWSDEEGVNQFIGNKDTRILGRMDIVDSTTRSRMMAQIRSKDTKPEMEVRRFLHAVGFRYRLHDRKLAGRPDIVLPKYRTIIFIHGCFWHQHEGCKNAYTPKASKEKWEAKFIANKARDRRALASLEEMGWNIIVIWECGLRNRTRSVSLDWLIEAIKQPARLYVEWPEPNHRFQR